MALVVGETVKMEMEEVVIMKEKEMEEALDKGMLNKFHGLLTNMLLSQVKKHSENC